MQDTNAKLPVHNLRDLAIILVKHHDLHEGRYEISVEFKIAAGNIGSTPEESLPSGIVGVSGVSLMKVQHDNIHYNIVDAAIENPK